MNKTYKNQQKVHFIGIGGVGMSSLASHLRGKGIEVSGSDICAKNALFLKKQGINVHNSHSIENVNNADMVVYTSAIKGDNAEFLYAKNKGIPLIKRSQLLGQILDEFSTSIAISGSHGKTTATDMLSTVLIEGGLDPTVFLGGFDKNFNNYRQGKSEIAVAEACEYEKNFLDLRPSLCVVLNVDNDHLDTYKNLDEVINAFRLFITDRVSVINADDKNSKSLCNQTSITFGIDNPACFRAQNLKQNPNGCYSFSVYHGTLKLGRITLNVQGKHNVYNALACIGVSHTLKVPFIFQKKALEKFSGVKRRNEYLGQFNNLSVYADYAHHPKEISAMLKTFASQNQDYLTIFQPHTYSRTHLLIKDFLECFLSCKPLIIYKTYPAREKYLKKGSAKTLYYKLKENGNDKVYYADNKKQLKDLIDGQFSNYKKAVFLGAGDIYEIAKSIVKNQNR